MLDAPYGPKLMHAAVNNRIAAVVANDVAVGVHLVDKPDLADRPVLQFKARYNVLFPEAVRNQIELWVFWLPSRETLGNLYRVWHEEAARSSQRRLGMTGKALIRIVAGAQSVGIGCKLRKNRIGFCQPVERISHRGRPVSHHRAVVAGR